ncbi:radical SAM/SPASM domain-containing protein [Limisalsivibrio acetivorans]|uniref:radical SAM/SPASM domain-containing protein n=1 Tax=Limisalsivibrio acetivorans TaxID=1304888 RepID=UPI0003B2E6DF|nr:radical SAM protein [Limisalsivibrio acetivorans]
MSNKWELKWMAWEITRKCNLNCVHCRSSSSIESAEGALTFDKCKSLMDEISEFAKPVIVLSGGEPLLRKDVFDIATYGTEKGFRMAMATNGMLVDDEVCENIKKSGIKIVSLSLDGPTAEIHDDFRGDAGSYDGVMRASELFNKHGIPFIINSSFTKRNQAYIEETYKLGKKLGATAWYMFLIVPTGRGEEVMKELVSKEDYEDILNWHYDMERQEEDIMVRPTCAPQYYRIWNERSKEEGKDTERRNLSFGTGGGKGCIAAQKICLVNFEGDVYPCSYFPLAAGNVFEQPLKEIWENSKLFNDIRNFKDYEGKCGSCKFLGVCGGCRARSYAVTGSYMEEEPFCDYIPQNYGACK